MNSWLPARYTPPLTEDFTSAIDPYIPAFQLIWRKAFGYTLSAWQIWLLRSILEVFPEGHPRAGQLRYRQVLISVARQNGKTEIAAALGIWGLLRDTNQLVIGIASSAEQATLVYDRTMKAIAANSALKRRFTAITTTRGIRATDGSEYQIKGASHAALQGLPISLGIVDEVHLLKDNLWTALVNGTGGRANAIVVGITTAGDDNSTLLQHLYKNGERAIQGEASMQRFGFYVWEAESSIVPEDDSEFLRLLMQANPSVAEGIKDGENTVTDARGNPEPDIVRYQLNRFVSAEDRFMTLDFWGRCAREPGERFPRPRRGERRTVFLSVDISRDKEWASIVASTKAADGIVHTELVHSVMKPTLAGLVELCVKLRAANPHAVFVADGYSGRELGAHLTQRGLQVRIISPSDMLNACSTFYSMVAQRRIRHASDLVLTDQLPKTKRVNRGDAWRIVPIDGVPIDAVMATATGVYVAETTAEPGPQLFT